jgi:hypothetical protein
VYVSQRPYRQLCESIYDYEGDALHRHILAPWLENNVAERDWLRELARREGSPVPSAEIEERCRLYALSRVSQVMLLPFQQGDADGSPWRGPSISLEEYVAFFEALGLDVLEPQQFSPFHHEIVEVDQAADRLEHASLIDVFWPCLMLGNLLFSRAGARIRAGSSVIDKQVAESSTLYWAYWRKNRPSHDLSHGCGSNSQWRTDFRRDYRDGASFHYNVDDTNDLAAPPSGEEDRDGLTREERTELLVHRCFVTTKKPHEDLWPYDDTLRVTG